MTIVEVGGNRLRQGDCFGPRQIERLGADIGLIGEVDRCLDQSGNLNQVRPPAVVKLRQRPARLTERLAALSLGFRVNEVGQPLDLRQIDLAVLERAAGEFTGLRRPAAGYRAQRIQYRGDDGPAAVNLKLGHVLARFTAGGLKENYYGTVNGLARLRMTDGAKSGMPGGCERRRHT